MEVTLHRKLRARYIRPYPDEDSVFRPIHVFSESPELEKTLKAFIFFGWQKLLKTNQQLTITNQEVFFFKEDLRKEASS